MASKAADIIRERIIKGYYPESARLIEEDLSSEFGISRACIREALLVLESEGMVLRESNKSTRVLQLTQKDIEDLFSFRLYLELLGVETIVDKNSVPVSALKKLLKKLDEIKLNDKSNSFKFIEADLNFHEEIILSSTNSYVINAWKKIKYQIMTLMFSLYNTFKEDFNIQGTNEHANILESLECGDVSSAQQILKQHIKLSFDYIMALSSRIYVVAKESLGE